MRSILTLIAVLALLAGCGSNTSGATVEFDDGLEKAITELARSGGTRPLKDLAPATGRPCTSSPARHPERGSSRN
jgi:hypothetical protein